MIGRLFVDTNVLIYSLDPREPAKRLRASNLLLSAHRADLLVTSPQCLNECYRVLTDRLGLMPQSDARNFIATLFRSCIAPLDAEVTQSAFRLQDSTGYHWWDCLLLASALRANCRIFATEDLSDGRMLEGMQIVDPFKHDVAL
ncbi:MAG: PIN domain-containing protein [Bauldia sp.]